VKALPALCCGQGHAEARSRSDFFLIGRAFLFARSHHEDRNMKNIQQHRMAIADNRLQTAARAEFGKLGFDIDQILKGSSDYKSHRNYARRMINELVDDLRKPGCTRMTNKDGTPNEVPTDALSWASAVIGVCDIQDELDDLGNQVGAGTQVSALRDIDGKRIGTMLNAATLRNEHSIAGAIGAHRDHSHGEFGLGHDPPARATRRPGALQFDAQGGRLDRNTQ